jgi:hypothetical protein
VRPVRGCPSHHADRPAGLARDLDQESGDVTGHPRRWRLGLRCDLGIEQVADHLGHQPRAQPLAEHGDDGSWRWPGSVGKLDSVDHTEARKDSVAPAMKPDLSHLFSGLRGQAGLG